MREMKCFGVIEVLSDDTVRIVIGGVGMEFGSGSTVSEEILSSIENMNAEMDKIDFSKIGCPGKCDNPLCDCPGPK